MISKRRKLFLEERHRQIQLLLEENGRVSVDELTLQFGVSKVTVRNDLAKLEEDGVVLRTHGGAIALAADSDRADPLFLDRQFINQVVKKRIGKAAGSLIDDGDTVLIDNGTTALYIARQLRRFTDLTVVTNCLPIAIELESRPGITVMVIGGMIHSGAMALVGEWANDNLEKINVDKAFLTSKGITSAEGLTDINTLIVETKRRMVEAAKEVIAVVDHSKWGRVAFASFADIEQLDTVITDKDAPEILVAEVRQAGVDVVVV